MSWAYLLGDKSKRVTQKNDGTVIVDATKTKSPTGILKLEIQKGKKYRPMSSGVDNYIYGLNTGNKRMIYTTDGFVTVVHGYDFFANAIGTPEFVTKTPTGYLVYINHPDGLTASIWQSQSFTDGFVKVLDLTNGYVAAGFVPRPWHNIEQGVVMVAEYTIAKDPLKPARCWISRRGGADGSWVLINTVENVNTTENFHFHGICYDPVQSRIYTSAGDYNNRKLEYSDDWGVTWKTITTDTQPTLMEVLPKYVVTTPDANDTVSINQLNKQIEGDYTVSPQLTKKINISTISSYGNFGRGPVGGLVGSNEMYVTFPESGSGVKKCFVAATGDGGESWHMVATIEPNNGVGLARGLVTDPISGLMYGWYSGDIFGDGTWEHLAKITPVGWA